MRALRRTTLLAVVLLATAMSLATTQVAASPTATGNGAAASMQSAKISLVVNFLGSSIITITCTGGVTFLATATTSLTLSVVGFATCTGTVLGFSCSLTWTKSGTWSITFIKLLGFGSYNTTLGVGGATIDLNACLSGCKLTIGSQTLSSAATVWTNATSPATTKDYAITDTMAFSSSGCGVSVTSANFTASYSTTDTISVTGS